MSISRILSNPPVVDMNSYLSVPQITLRDQAALRQCYALEARNPKHEARNNI